MADYDKYYRTEELFGAPFPELMEFFREYEPKGNILDLGCGQGRNAIPLARLGYKVTGIDRSKVGIDQMMSTAKSKGLSVTGLVGDLYKFQDYEDFDTVLLDSMLHFQKRDKQKEIELIESIINRVHKDGILCFCIQDTGNKAKVLKSIFEKSESNFEILNDSSLIYNFEDKESGHISRTKYCMYIVRKK